jgi:hypothetical protein
MKWIAFACLLVLACNTPNKTVDKQPVDKVSYLSVPASEIPSTFFGMHLISVWVPGTVWPPVPIGLYRLVDATPRWHHLSLSPGELHDDKVGGGGVSRIYAALLFRDRFGPGTPALYTLGGGGDDLRDGVWGGGWPQWLVTDSLDAWRSYVRTLGTRFKGDIRYWEVWNEPDCTCFYQGTPEMLAELTRIAAEELRAIDPSNVIIAPAFTEESVGLGMMDDFLKAGGGRYVDIMAWHQLNRAEPEQDTTRIKEVLKIMERNGVGHLPLWTTEGHSLTKPGADDAAILARTYLTLWLYGVQSFSWYAWDMYEYDPLPGEAAGPWVYLVEHGRRDQPTAAGVAYGELYRWMVGATVRSAEIKTGRWVVELDRGWIVWQTGTRPVPWAVPGAVERVLHLDGSETLPGTEHTPTARPVFFRRG